MYLHHLTAHPQALPGSNPVPQLCASQLPRYCVSNLQHSPEEKPFLTYSPAAGNGREDLLRPRPLGNQLHSASPAEPASSRDIAEGQRKNCTSCYIWVLLRFHNLGYKISLGQSLAMTLDKTKNVLRPLDVSGISCHSV